MLSILNIQREVHTSLSTCISTPIYFYPPRKREETYVKINSIKIYEGNNLGEGLAAVEVNLKVHSNAKSSANCLQIMDKICACYQQQEIKFSTFVINNIGDLERALTVNQELEWIGEITLYFWLELIN